MRPLQASLSHRCPASQLAVKHLSNVFSLQGILTDRETSLESPFCGDARSPAYEGTKKPWEP